MKKNRAAYDIDINKRCLMISKYRTISKEKKSCK